jgi:hypothetical protein
VLYFDSLTSVLTHLDIASTNLPCLKDTKAFSCSAMQREPFCMRDQEDCQIAGKPDCALYGSSKLLRHVVSNNINKPSMNNTLECTGLQDRPGLRCRAERREVCRCGPTRASACVAIAPPGFALASLVDIVTIVQCATLFCKQQMKFRHVNKKERITFNLSIAWMHAQTLSQTIYVSMSSIYAPSTTGHPIVQCMNALTRMIYMLQIFRST